MIDGEISIQSIQTMRVFLALIDQLVELLVEDKSKIEEVEKIARAVYAALTTLGHSL